MRFVATRGVVHAVAPARRVGNRWASGRARRCRYPVAGYAVGADGRRPPRTGTLDWYVPRLILEFLMQFLASCVAGTPSGRPARPGRRRHRAPRGPGLVHGPAAHRGAARTPLFDRKYPPAYALRPRLSLFAFSAARGHQLSCSCLAIPLTARSLQRRTRNARYFRHYRHSSVSVSCSILEHHSYMAD